MSWLQAERWRLLKNGIKKLFALKYDIILLLNTTRENENVFWI